MKPCQIEFRSPHPPAECAALLSRAIEFERSALFSFAGLNGRPVLGCVDKGSIYLRKRLSYRNVFQSLFTGAMRSEGDGTLIIGSFSMHPFGLGCLVLWFSIVIIVGSVAVLAVAASLLAGAETGGGEAWLGAITPAGLAVVSVVLVIVGRHLARAEEWFITDFLIRTLDADPEG